ncbi:MAG TPA: nuclear transport factor 2 family protein [Candidatus Limnocylindrales bacterium]
MTHEQFQDWLNRYVEAWKTYDSAQIGALFSAEAEYRYHPQDEPERGRDAILAAWLENRDDPGTYDAKYHPLAIDADGTHVASGWSRYFETPGGDMRDEYWNIYVCRFNDAGECTSFIEYWIQNRQLRKRAIDEIVRKRRAEAGQPQA